MALLPKPSLALVCSITSMLMACSADSTNAGDGGTRDTGRHSDVTAHDGPVGDGTGTDDTGMMSSSCLGITCASAGANCGPISDGCGGLIDCGPCADPTMSCGGSGMSSVCGAPITMCVPNTSCGAANCGPVPDGCGGMIDCGATCPAGQSCGGGGTASVCGSGMGTGTGGCVLGTCGAANCGPVADGCGGLINCGTCVGALSCGGGGVASVCGSPSTHVGGCTNLCLRQMTCAAGVTTTLSGTVFAPNGTDPLYNALVYIPNAPVDAFTPGVTCGLCADGVSGSPLVSTVTGPDGRFTLTNVPTGADVPVVIQLGRWRRQVSIPLINPCSVNHADPNLTRLPRNHTEGDIPLMAMVTGGADSLECVLRKIGLDDSEFTTPSGGGRVQFYLGQGGSDVSGGAPAMSSLVGSAAALAAYDMVLFACWGAPVDQAPADQQRVIDYSNVGGRVFATHFSYVWLYNDAPFSSTATWNVGQGDPPDPLPATVDTSFPRGMAFAQWLVNVGASTTLGQVSLNQTRHDFDAVLPPSQQWIYYNSPATRRHPATTAPLHYTFNTPVGASDAATCGRVLFSDFHVTTGGGSPFGGNVFPTECSTGPLTAQEKVLEFMIFDLSSCVPTTVGSMSPCSPTSCAAAHANCGQIGDGCGGTLNCGTCSAPDSCGGGGQASTCGHSGCAHQTCAGAHANCGPIADGCGGSVDCGMCTPPDTCGGGGMPSVCGHPGCVPQTCSGVGATCGMIGDGCGSSVDCGPCTAPQTCGGGGTPNQCGTIG